ncbi:MAG: hypothetical protein ACO1QB_06480 [Verrucomicrobiales bacterium]
MEKLFSKFALLACSLLGSASYVNGAVNLVWDHSPDDLTDGTVAGYKVYYGPMDSATIMAGMETNAVTGFLLPEKLYNFAVTAFDERGVESEFSNFLPFFSPSETRANVNLTWDHSPDVNDPGLVAGYKIRYGYATSIKDAGLTTSITLSDVPIGQPYFFAVSAYNTFGVESEPSNVAVFMNTGNAGRPGDEISPPIVSAYSFVAPFSPYSSMGTPGSDPAQGLTNSPVIVRNIIGTPPMIKAELSKTHTQLTIWGTAGSTFTVQKSVDPGSPDKWVTVTNITLETLVQLPVTTPNHQVPEIIKKAFCPASKTWKVERSEGEFVFYRAIQQQDYEALADQALKALGYTTRLVMVRLAEDSSYVLCYVPEEKAFIHYDSSTHNFILQPADDDIQNIANAVSSLLKENWTSASEFVMAENQKQIVATSVKLNTPSTSKTKTNPVTSFTTTGTKEAPSL